MRSFMITTVLAALTTLAVGSNVSPLKGYGFGTMQWKGLSNGVNVTLNGSASEIIQQLKARDSEWIPAPQRPGYVAPIIPRSAEGQKGSTLCCPVKGQTFTSVNAEDLQQAAQDLMAIGEYCIIQPKECEVAECDDNAGIWACNDNSQVVETLCANLGNYANVIIDDCLTDAKGYDGLFVCGQVFDTSGYNVIANTCP